MYRISSILLNQIQCEYTLTRIEHGERQSDVKRYIKIKYHHIVNSTLDLCAFWSILHLKTMRIVCASHTAQHTNDFKLICNNLVSFSPPFHCLLQNSIWNEFLELQYTHFSAATQSILYIGMRATMLPLLKANNNKCILKFSIQKYVV